MTSLRNVDGVTEMVGKRLQRSPYAAVRRVTCYFDEGVLVLQGDVPSYYQKQLAQSAVTGFSSIERVANRIRVTADIQNG
jgi:osmotically-inducible protein OsmY